MNIIPSPRSEPVTSFLSDKHSNGQKWENLALKLSELFNMLSEVTGSSPLSWRPMLLSNGATSVASGAWRKLEAEHRDRIHEATRALINTARVPDHAPEIVYFLGLRLLAALDHIEAMIAIKDDTSVSLWPFPALPPNEVVEWLLTEWADDHVNYPQ